MSTVIHCSNASTSTTFTSWFQQSHIFSSASWFANEKWKPILLENSWILLAWWRGSRIAINDLLYIFFYTSLTTLLATMNQLVKKKVKEAKEKEEDNRMISKPYPAWIDSVPYTPGFSQPDLSSTERGDPHQHLAHFLVRCGPVAQNGALCLRLFVQSLEGPWYAHLSEESIRKQGSRSSGSSSATHKEGLECPNNSRPSKGIMNLSRSSLQGGEPLLLPVPRSLLRRSSSRCAWTTSGTTCRRYSCPKPLRDSTTCALKLTMWKHILANGGVLRSTLSSFRYLINKVDESLSFSIIKVDFFFTAYMRKTRVLTFLSLALRAIGSVLFSLSTSSFWPNFKIFYARPYQHGKPSFPPFEVHLSDQLPESLERRWKAHYFFIHGLFFVCFDWSPHSTWGKREVIQRKVISCNA